MVSAPPVPASEFCREMFCIESESVSRGPFMLSAADRNPRCFGPFHTEAVNRNPRCFGPFTCEHVEPEPGRERCGVPDPEPAGVSAAGSVVAGC